VLLDQERCYRAVASRDARFDGHFITAVRTTGIYCRPSCPATTPKRANVEFLPTAGAAQQRGYRACRRCLPDAVPGSPDWNVRADLAARAMRLISDGVVERDGVPGLATRLGYSERHLNRVLTAELGAGPLARARAPPPPPPPSPRFAAMRLGSRSAPAGRGSWPEKIRSSLPGLTRQSMLNPHICGHPAWMRGSSPRMTRQGLWSGPPLPAMRGEGRGEGQRSRYPWNGIPTEGA
jgi:methylphosphotriester-DNA--protein-cysteine methyltransferase